MSISATERLLGTACFELALTLSHEARQQLACLLIHSVMTESQIPTVIIDDFGTEDTVGCPCFIYAAHGEAAVELKASMQPALVQLAKEGKAEFKGDSES